MKEQYCQSCAMPMGDTNEYYGTEKNGDKSQDYCSYCYEQGQFKYDCTMQEMIDICLPHMLKDNADMDEKQAKAIMTGVLPTLKRWK